MSASFFNKLWLSRQSKFADEFHRNAPQIDSYQTAKLRQYLDKNSNTAFGKKQNFASIKNYEDFKQAVPVLEGYADLKPYIDQIAAGESDILFPGKPLFFETTSGTSNQVKLIAYNKQLKQEFGKGVASWMHDLNRLDPKIFSGKSYWSLSPALKDHGKSSGGIRVGTSNDSDYFDPINAFFLNKIFAVPGQISRITDPHEFYVHTWSHLLTCKKLTFISVWSPQFLIRLVDFFMENIKEICFESGVTGRWADFIQSKMAGGEFTLELIFPDLKMISCWTHGQSRVWLQKLKSMSGKIPIQGKGLMSTEGVVSIPIGMEEHALTYTSHFYEFKDNNQNVYTSNDLQEGAEYEVIITTAGGLYRYNTHDQVRCTGFYYSVPCVEFIGRSGQNSDMVGEKLHENMLYEIFADTLSRFPELESLYLYPFISENQAGYSLIIESGTDLNVQHITDFVEKSLSKNPYYQQAIRAGQLLPLSYKRVHVGFTGRLIAFYQQDKKIKDGDLKLPLLYAPHYLDTLLQMEDK